MPAGAAASVAFRLSREARIVMDGVTPTVTVEGTRRVEVVEGGALGEDPVVFRELAADLVITSVGVDGSTETWTSGAEPLPGAARWLEPDRRVTLGAEVFAEPAYPEGTPGDDGVDVAEILEGLLHAPDERLDAGATWSRDLGDSERTWTLSSIGGGVAVVAETNRPKDEPVERTFERRSRLTVDTRTGLPLTWRKRDLRRSTVGFDAEATFTWE